MPFAIIDRFVPTYIYCCYGTFPYFAGCLPLLIPYFHTIAELCPNNWHYLHSPDGNRCYQYFGEPKTWAAASDACQAINGQLATANNYEENK